MPTPLILGEFEQVVLLAILQLGNGSQVLPLRQRISQVAGREISRGALYRTLDRLEERGWVDWEIEDGTPERGGHAPRRFHVTRQGVEALRASRRTLQTLWRGLEEVLG